MSGIRSEYDIMSSVFKAIHNHSELELRLVVTGAHLSDHHGLTINEIHKDEFLIVDKIDSLLSSNEASSRVKGLAIQLQGLVQTAVRVKPDILLVLGDREEAITTALVGAYMNIAVAHICGGDRVIGNVDDQVRHAVTKLAHLHFVTNEESARRVADLGEQNFRIFNVGNPGLDRLLDVPAIDMATLSSSIGFDLLENEPYLLLIQHVISTEIDQAYAQMKITMEAVKELGIKTILIRPNSDAGSQQMIRAIDEYKALPFVHVSKNISRLEFVNILRRATCLLGNSSAGILEAPLLKLPVINIGNRQLGRLHAENVQFVEHDKFAIVKAVQRATFDLAYKEIVKKCKNPYGDGRSSQRIADILAKISIDRNLMVKDITY